MSSENLKTDELVSNFENIFNIFKDMDTLKRSEQIGELMASLKDEKNKEKKSFFNDLLYASCNVQNRIVDDFISNDSFAKISAFIKTIVKDKVNCVNTFGTFFEGKYNFHLDIHLEPLNDIPNSYTAADRSYVADMANIDNTTSLVIRYDLVNGVRNLTVQQMLEIREFTINYIRELMSKN